MKKIIYTFLSLSFALSVNAQLTNNGASIIVEDGATLFIEGSLQNNLTGSIDIQGTGIVEVEGDITIAPTSTVTMSNTARLILSGANTSTVTSGGATFTNVEMDKTASTVTLMDQMRISTDLNFVGDDNKLILGDNNLVFAPSATITSADDNEYIVADGMANTGVVSKELSADEEFKFEIGDATNYTPLNADISGSGYSSATVDVNVVPADQPNKPANATDFISRYWNVDQSGVTDYSADLEGTYVAGDLTGMAADTKGAHYNGTDWFYTGAATGTNSVIGTVAESGDFTGTNSFGKANLKVMLDGAFSGGTMSNTLNTMDLLPTTSPYGGGETVAAGFFAANTDIVDWIEIEARNPATPGMTDGKSAGFLKTDGSIVGLDGSSSPLILNAGSTGYVVINHRNHLSVSTAAAINLDGVALQDFTDVAYAAYGTNGLRNNGGTMTMWSGAVNNDDIVKYQGGSNDGIEIRNDILDHPGNFFNFLTYSYTGYEDEDVNMDGTIKYQGGNNDYILIRNSVLVHPSNFFNFLTFAIDQQIPN